jgi:Protein of unknown function, DUF255
MVRNTRPPWWRALFLVFFIGGNLMNTVFASVVLASALLAGQNPNPAWQTDYSQAQEQASMQKKPLVVVFGSGANGWTKVVRDSTPSADVTKMMSEQYVCVYVDVANPAGRKLAQAFSIQGDTGIVISDRSGLSQAFWHQGNMTNQSMVQYLQTYADPTVVVRTTETTATRSRTSLYPPGESDGNGGNVGSGSYCPSCNNARSRR